MFKNWYIISMARWKPQLEVSTLLLFFDDGEYFINDDEEGTVMVDPNY